MPTEFADMSIEAPFHKIKLAIVGKEKAGKSRLAATGRKNVLFLDFDNRRESVAGIPGVYAISFRDNQWPNQPSVYNETLDLLTQMEQSALKNEGRVFLRDLGFSPTPNVAPTADATVGTIVCDSTQSFAKSVMSYALYTNKDIRYEVSLGQIKIHSPKSFTAWNSEMSMVEQALLRMFALPCDVIWTFHESPEEAPGSTEESPQYTGRIEVFPVRYKRLIKYFNDCWHVERDSAAPPRVTTVPTFAFTAATVLNIDPVEQPDISAIIAKHISRNGTGAAK